MKKKTKRKVRKQTKPGLNNLLGKQVLVFCLNYIYTGKLIQVNAEDILLAHGKIVYETGAFTSQTFKDAQAIAPELYVRTSSIESFSITDKQ